MFLTKDYKLRSKDLPTPTQISKAVPCTPDQLLTNQRFLPTLSFGLNHLLEQLRKLRKPIHSLDDWLIMNGITQEMLDERAGTHGMWKGWETLCSPGALASANLRVFTNPEAS